MGTMCQGTTLPTRHCGYRKYFCSVQDFQISISILCPLFSLFLIEKGNVWMSCPFRARKQEPQTHTSTWNRKRNTNLPQCCVCFLFSAGDQEPGWDDARGRTGERLEHDGADRKWDAGAERRTAHDPGHAREPEPDREQWRGARSDTPARHGTLPAHGGLWRSPGIQCQLRCQGPAELQNRCEDCRGWIFSQFF